MDHQCGVGLTHKVSPPGRLQETHWRVVSGKRGTGYQGRAKGLRSRMNILKRPHEGDYQQQQCHETTKGLYIF